MSHVALLNASYQEYDYESWQSHVTKSETKFWLRHTEKQYGTRLLMSHVTFLRHVALLNASYRECDYTSWLRHIIGYVVSRVSMAHGYEWGRTHATHMWTRAVWPNIPHHPVWTWIRHVTYKYDHVTSHMNESCRTWMGPSKHKRVMSHMNKSCRAWMSPFAHGWVLSL